MRRRPSSRDEDDDEYEKRIYAFDKPFNVFKADDPLYRDCREEPGLSYPALVIAPDGLDSEKGGIEGGYTEGEYGTPDEPTAW